MNLSRFPGCSKGQKSKKLTAGYPLASKPTLQVQIGESVKKESY
jgi:hypothetical protein